MRSGAVVADRDDNGIVAGGGLGRRRIGDPGAIPDGAHDGVAADEDATRPLTATQLGDVAVGRTDSDGTGQLVEEQVVARPLRRVGPQRRGDGDLLHALDGVGVDGRGPLAGEQSCQAQL